MSNRHRKIFECFNVLLQKNLGYISNLNKSLIAASNHVYLNCNAFWAFQADWYVENVGPHYSWSGKIEELKFEEKNI